VRKWTRIVRSLVLTPRKVVPGVLFLLLVSLIMLPSVAVQAAQVTLAWDPDSNPEVSGYKLRYGTESAKYSSTLDTGDYTSYTVASLQPGVTYYFAATAYDPNKIESDFSNEVSYTVPADCTYSISPTTATISSAARTGSITVTTQSGCGWTAASGSPWITIASGVSGVGAGTVTYSVSANTGESRVAASTIAGQVFTLTQLQADSFVIAASASSGGSVSPSGISSVPGGGSQTYMISPENGYVISRVTVDGLSVGKPSQYTFSGISANHTISATFTRIFNLTVVATGSGIGIVNTKPRGTSFAEGSIVTLTAVRGTGSTFTGWSGACSGSNKTCRVTMNGDTYVSATFTLKSYAITASASTGGSISPSGSLSAGYGSTQPFAITPDTGYMVRKVYVDGWPRQAKDSFTLENIRTSHKVVAVFAPIATSH
jgi:hypothetical protein